MAIDPKERKKEREDKGWSEDGPGTNFLRQTGKFPMAVCGWERFHSSQKGTPGIMIRFVVVEGPNAGEVIDRDFWLSERALAQLADFALAFGFEEPFDEHSDDDMERIVSHGVGVVNVVVKSEGYTKSDGSAGTKFIPNFFNPYRGAAKDSWGEWITKGEASFQAYLQWRTNNPRPKPGDAPRGQGGGGRGGAGGGTSGSYGGGGQGGGGGSYEPPDGDVPF